MTSLGDTYLGGAAVHGEDHLWIVINEPAKHGHAALVVNISTLRAEAETTCVLQRGEHVFIRHESYVRYQSARAVKTSDFARLPQAGYFKPHQPASVALLDKLRAGALASPFLATELKALL